MADTIQKSWDFAVPEIAYRAQDFYGDTPDILKNFLDPTSHRIAWNYKPTPKFQNYLAAIPDPQKELPFVDKRFSVRLSNDQKLEFYLDPELVRPGVQPLLAHLRSIGDTIIDVLGNTIEFDTPEIRFTNSAHARKAYRVAPKAHRHGGAFTENFHVDGAGANKPDNASRPFTVIDNLIGRKTRFLPAEHYAHALEEACAVMEEIRRKRGGDMDLNISTWIVDGVKRLISSQLRKKSARRKLIDEADSFQINIWSRARQIDHSKRDLDTDDFERNVMGIHARPKRVLEKRLLIVWSGQALTS